MGWFNLFRRRATRYAAIIALIGSLTFGAKNALAQEGRDLDSKQLDAIATQVQKDLSRNNINKDNIRALSRKLAVLKGTRSGKKIKIPLNLAGGIDSLDDFYRMLDIEKKDLDKQGKVLFFRNKIKGILKMMEELQEAEWDLVITLDDEREELRDYIKKLVAKIKRDGHDLRGEELDDFDLLFDLQKIENFVISDELQSTSRPTRGRVPLIGD